MKSITKIKSNKRRGDGKIVRKVAIYIRVSTLEQRDNGDSLRMQREELTKWAKENDYIIYDYYMDDGYTATSLKRPELQRMLSESENFDLIIFYRLDRFSRGVANYYKVMETLDSTNTHWKSITEDYDTTTPNGRLSINIMLSIAENESALTSERIKAVFKNKLENGEIIGGSISLGYKVLESKSNEGTKKSLIIDEESAEQVRYMFEHYDKYGSLNMTVKHLIKDKGWKSDNKKLKGILTNKLYVGTYVAPSIGEFPDFCPPIIDRELFYRVQKKIEKNAKNYISVANKTYIFSGLMRCSECGIRLAGNTKKRKSRDGLSERLEKGYRCQYHQRKRGCENNKYAHEPTIEKYLIENARSLLSNKILDYKVEQKKEKPKDDVQHRISKVKTDMTKLKNLYMKDIILEEEYEKDYTVLKEQLDSLLTKVTEPPKEFNESYYQKFLSHSFEEMYHTLNDLEKRRLWLSIIDTIHFGRDGIVIDFV